MDIQGRTPQHGMRPHDVTPPQRPQGYGTPPPRPSVDGFGPPSPQPHQPPHQPLQQPADTDHMLPPGHPNPPSEAPDTGPQVLEPTHDHHRSSKPVVLAIITLFIAVGLAVAAFFAFRPETAEKVNKVNVPNTESQTATSTSDAVDEATSDINKQVEGQNDSQDFSDSELSDQTLGL